MFAARHDSRALSYARIPLNLKEWGYMKFRYLTPALAIMAIGPQALSNEIELTDYKVHVLEEGETLSELLYKEDYRPLYGANQWVDRILKANHITMEEAKKLEKGSPVILPTKDFLLASTTTDKDIVAIKQSAISHGLFGNKISKHQNISVGLQYHVNSLSTGSTKVTSQENYGLLLGYEDLNNRYWGEYAVNPKAQLGVLTHGTNTTDNGSEVISYDPTVNFQTQLALTKFDSNFSFGPMAAWQSASRASEDNGEISIRRDHLMYAGGFVSKSFYSANDLRIDLSANLLKSFFDQETHGLKNLDATRADLELKTNLTSDYFVSLFSRFESYSNNNLESMTSAGARLIYNLH